MKLEAVDKFAKSLPEVTRAPHFYLDSYRIRGKIFVTADASAGFIRVFVPEEVRETALAGGHPSGVKKLFWGKKAVGLQVQLERASPAAVRNLVRAAWLAKAPKTLARQLPGYQDPGLPVDGYRG